MGPQTVITWHVQEYDFQLMLYDGLCFRRTSDSCPAVQMPRMYWKSTCLVTLKVYPSMKRNVPPYPSVKFSSHPGVPASNVKHRTCTEMSFWKQSVLIGIVCLFASVMISVGYRITKATHSSIVNSPSRSMTTRRPLSVLSLTKMTYRSAGALVKAIGMVSEQM